MNLSNGTALFKELVRAPNFRVMVLDLLTRRTYCPEHGDDAPHYYSPSRADEPPVCAGCIEQSRALAYIGSAGGRKGGKALTPRKLDQLRAANRAARDRARERRAAQHIPEGAKP